HIFHRILVGHQNICLPHSRSQSIPRRLEVVERAISLSLSAASFHAILPLLYFFQQLHAAAAAEAAS
mgnify:CR=1